jgi:type IV pilus assembly protein PilM
MKFNVFKKRPEGKQKEKTLGVYYLPVKHAFGLDLSDASLKAVEVSRRGNKYFIEAHSSIMLPPNVIYHGEVKDEQALRLALKDLIEKARPRPIKTKFVVASFPEASVFLHPFEFPAALSYKQVADAIPYEAESEMPILLSEMYTDIKFHRSRENGHHVVFTAAPKKLVDLYIKVLNEAGLFPVAIDLDSPALISSFMTTNDNPVIILDIGAWSSTITIVEREMVHGYVSVPIGGSSITQLIADTLSLSFDDAEKLKKDKGVFGALADKGDVLESHLRLIVSEIEKAAKFHEQHTGRPVQQLIVSGGTALAADFMDFLTKTTGYKVASGDPLASKQVEFAGTYSKNDKEEFVGMKESLASTFGLAIRGSIPNISGSGLNLLPQKFRDIYENWRIQLILAVLSLAVMTVVFLAFIFSIFWFAGTIYKKDQVQLDEIAFKKSFPEVEFEKAKVEIKTANQEIGALKVFDARRFDLPSGLNLITAAAPSGIKILDFKITSADSSDDPSLVEITGKAATRSDIINFDKTLRAMKNVTTVDSPLSNLNQPTDASFKLKVEINLPRENYDKKP